MDRLQLIICGSIAIDRIMNFSGQYKDLIDSNQLDVLSVSVLVDSFDEAQGGTGGNIAHTASFLGEKPILLGSVGTDATNYLNRLRDQGVDISHVHSSQLPTASFNVLTDTSGNQVGGFYPGAMADAASLSFLGLSKMQLFACISAHDPSAMRRQTDECSENNIRLFYDPGQQVSNISADDLNAGITAAELLIVNEYELNLFAKKTGITVAELQASVPVVISTHGENGSVISGASVAEHITVQSAKPEKIVDPTGAGDAYRAGFLYGYLRQWELGKCGQLGSVTASFALEQHGPQASFTKQQIIDRYQQTFNEEIEL